MNNPLFHEVYGAYFGITAAILTCQQSLTTTQLTDFIKNKGFDESLTQLLPSLQNKKNSWMLLKENNDHTFTPITKNQPPTIQTSLERQWLKAILNAPQINYFLDKKTIDSLQMKLDATIPLYNWSDINYFDQFKQLSTPEQIEIEQNHFKILLNAIVNSHSLIITYQKQKKQLSSTATFQPYKIEYSQKNNLFRLKAWKVLPTECFEVTLNLNRILSIEKMEQQVNFEHLNVVSYSNQATITCLITDERQALSRSMLHFSDYQKTTRKLEENGQYELVIYYDIQDETELIIRLLSFGPFIKVTSPHKFITKICARINQQKTLMKTLMAE